MPEIKSKSSLLAGLLSLCALPGVPSAEQRIPADYIGRKPLLLEVRYCECPAASTSGPFELLPDFLSESERLRAGVALKDAGFLASREFSIGYQLKPAQDSPGKFQLEYAGSYIINGESTSAQGKFLLAEDQWVYLFGSYHDGENGLQHSSAALRLTRTGGS